MKKLLTPAELAGLLGLAPQTIYNRHSGGASLPPCVRIGRLVRFPLDGVEAWIAAQAEQPLVPPPPQARRPGRPTKAEQIARRQGGAQ
jgi:predicted DNA-binding transcriptional regulator AlpA